jgi:signal transduction histidine kinase
MMGILDPPTGAPAPGSREGFEAEALGNLSHDLNNSLSVILTSATSLLRREPPDPTTHRQLELIHRSALRIHELTEELTDAVALELGQIELKLVPLDAGQLLAEAVTLAQKLATQRSLRFSGGAGPLWIRGDRLRLQRVFSHLLRSALSASLDGTVQVTLELRPPDLCVRIQEDGTATAYGTDSAFRPSETQRKSLARYVSNGVVLAHGGRFWIEPRGAMNAFLISLPVTERPAHSS